MDYTTVYYIPTEKYSPKSYVINFPTQVCSSQSEKQMKKPQWFMSFMPNFPPFTGACSLCSLVIC